MIVGLTGWKRHGKGTAGQVLVEEFGFVQVDFTDALNDMLMVLNPIVGTWGSTDWNHDYDEPIHYRQAIETYGYEQAKEVYPEIVRLLQVFGTDVGRKMIDPDIWIDQWTKRIVPLVCEGKNVVTTNVRFDNEAHRIMAIATELGQGHKIWKCIRPGYIHDPEAHKHRSERGIDETWVDDEITASTVLENQTITRSLIKQWL